ncbi:hypothetical protein N9V83_00460 [Flavobacteriales bacterium]|nr:hypothetical protein [Flavobacteriales bacterium]
MKNIALIISLGLSLLSYSQWERVDISEDIFLDEIEELPDGSLVVSGHKTDFTGTRSGIYRSTDGGYTWDLINDFAFAGQHISKMNWIDSQTAYFGSLSEYNDGVLLSTDDQASSLFWVSGLNTITGVKDLSFLSEEVGAVLSDDDKLYLTTNSGLTWKEKSYPSVLKVSLIEIFNENIFYLIGSNVSQTEFRIYKTINAGNSWTEVYAESGINVEVVDFQIKNSAFAAWNANGNFNIINSIDGSNWTDISPSENIANASSFYAYDNQEVYVTSYDELKDSSAVHWRKNNGDLITEYITQDTTANKCVFTSNSHGIVLGDYGQIFIKDQLLGLSNSTKQIPFFYAENNLRWKAQYDLRGQLRIYQLNGQEILRKEITGSSLDITSLPHGYFIAQMIWSNGQTSQLKFTR